MQLKQCDKTTPLRCTCCQTITTIQPTTGIHSVRKKVLDTSESPIFLEIFCIIQIKTMSGRVKICQLYFDTKCAGIRWPYMLKFMDSFRNLHINLHLNSMQKRNTSLFWVIVFCTTYMDTYWNSSYWSIVYHNMPHESCTCGPQLSDNKLKITAIDPLYYEIVSPL